MAGFQYPATIEVVPGSVYNCFDLLYRSLYSLLVVGVSV